MPAVLDGEIADARTMEDWSPPSRRWGRQFVVASLLDSPLEEDGFELVVALRTKRL
jgi:hypothetical protein